MALIILAVGRFVKELTFWMDIISTVLTMPLFIFTRSTTPGITNVEHSVTLNAKLTGLNNTFKIELKKQQTLLTNPLF